MISIRFRDDSAACRIGRPCQRTSGRGCRAYPLVCKRISEPVGVMTRVGEHPFGSGHLSGRAAGSGVVADLACGHEELLRTTLWRP